MASSLNKKQVSTVFTFVLCIYVFSWASIKICLPALPGLTKVFHTDPGYLKLSISMFFYTFAASMPVWGSLSEYFGRKRPMLWAFIITAIGSVFCMFANGIGAFLIGRALEGLGMGAVSPIGRSMLTDVFDREDLAKKLSIVAMAIWCMPAIAPILGGYLLTFISWRAIFAFMLIFAIAYWIMVKVRLPETNLERSHDHNPLHSYMVLLKSGFFWRYSLVYGLLTGGILSYYTAMPFWYVSQWHVSENTYAYLSIATVLAYIAGLLISNLMQHLHKSGRWIIQSLDSDGMVVIALIIGIVSTLACFGVGRVVANSIPFIITSVSLFSLCAGLAMPTLNACIMRKFHHIAGPASAATTLIIYVMAGCITLVTTNLPVRTIDPVLLYTGVLLLASFIILKLGNKKQPV